MPRWLTLPNLLTLLRLALVPVLLGAVWAGAARPSFWLLTLAFATDLGDGFLARRLGQVTALGASLDSVADAGIFIVVVLGGWRLFPQVVHKYAPWIVAALALSAAAQAVSLARYRRPAGFHTWLAKATGGVAAIALLSLFWAPAVTWPAYVACGMGVLAQMEQLAIAATLREWQADLPSWWHMRR